MPKVPQPIHLSITALIIFLGIANFFIQKVNLFGFIPYKKLYATKNQMKNWKHYIIEL